MTSWRPVLAVYGGASAVLAIAISVVPSWHWSGGAVLFLVIVPVLAVVRSLARERGRRAGIRARERS